MNEYNYNLWNDIKDILKTIPEKKFNQDILWDNTDKCGCVLGHINKKGIFGVSNTMNLKLYEFGFLIDKTEEIINAAINLNIPLDSFGTETPQDAIHRMELIEQRYA